MENKADNDDDWRAGMRSRASTPGPGSGDHSFVKSRNPSGNSRSTTPGQYSSCGSFMEQSPSMTSLPDYSLPGLGNPMENTHMDFEFLLSKVTEHHERMDTANLNQDMQLPPLKLLIYGDNSNIFIASQKKAGQVLNLKSEQDPRARINWQNLREIVAGERVVLDTNVYASHPPCLAKLGETLAEINIKLKAFKKINGKEKRVDTTLVAEAVRDMMNVVHNSYPGAEDSIVSFIVLSGDLDLAPIAEIGSQYGKNVEIWSYKDSLSAEMQSLSMIHSCVSTHTLDEHFHSFVYWEYNFPLTAKRNVLERNMFVLLYKTWEFDEKDRLENAVIKSTELLMIPTQGYYNKNKDLVLVLMSENNFELKINELCEQLKDCDFVQSYDEYTKVYM